VARVVARVVDRHPLDDDCAGVRVDAGDSEAGRLLGPVAAEGPEATYRLPVLRPADREGRVPLLDHAGHLGAHALREVLVKREGRYLGRHCVPSKPKRDALFRGALALAAAC
jgi:hypothetical protein